MGVTRRSVVGGVFSGLGEGLGNYFAKQSEDALLRRRQAETQQAITQREQDAKRADLIRNFTDRVAQHPDQYETLAQGARLDPMLSGYDFSALKPTPATLLKPLTELI